ncbi:MAG TPA: 2-C-methyl-D-erythritol 4-phosphate cytidylyltransferase [Pseudobacteroides sp.]|uniref:2-C-methyl-D-erythritol 4-phosphate cytidylyltransferase n=1 Tax=Pseudobacteroides sp. TaxID=1968840 RepID=UPI002F946B20
MQRSNSFVSAIIVAAGSGTRMNMEKNKMYIDVGAKPLLARTIQVFQESSLIDEIILVTGSGDIVFCKQHIIDWYDLNKVKKIVAGGKERQNSVYNGLCEVCERTDVVLIHDGARPFINDEIIKNSIDAAVLYGAAGVAVPVKDTIKVSDEEAYIKDTPDRKYLWAIQTPQSFKYDIVLNAHRRAVEDGYIGTDDAVLVERMGHRMKLIMGSYYNIKITTMEDIAFANAIVENMDKGL